MHQKNKLPALRFHFAIFFLLTFTSATVFAQVNWITPQYKLSKYTQVQGLSGYNVRKILVDKYGFIWIASIAGLNRFNGNEFKVFDNKTERYYRIIGTDISDMCIDQNEDNLWLLPAEKVLHKINIITSKVIGTYFLPSRNISQWNICLVNNKERLWIGTTNGLLGFDKLKEEFFDLPKILKDAYIEKIEKFNNAYLIIGLRGGILALYDIKKNSVISTFNILKNPVSNFFYKCIRVLPNEEILIGSQVGIQAFIIDKDHNLQERLPNKYVLNGLIQDIQLDATGKLWCAGLNGLFEFRDNLWLKVKADAVSESDQWLNQLNSFTSDKHGALWLGTQQGIAFKSSRESPFIGYSKDFKTGISLPHVRSILERENEILLGLRNGLVGIVDKKWKEYPIKGTIYHMFKDHKNLVHISNNSGWKLDAGAGFVNVGTVYPELKHWQSLHFNSHLYLGDSAILIGSESDEGILIWNFKKNTVKQICDSGEFRLNNRTVNNIYKDKKERIWVLSDNTLTILDLQLRRSLEISFKEIIKQDSYHLFFDMCQVGTKYYLTSYGHGILILNNEFKLEKVIDRNGGLANEGVYQIFPINDSSLLVTSNNGLSVIHIPSYKVQNYFEIDGLHGAAFEEVAGIKSGQYIMAGGINGFTLANTNNLISKTEKPTLYWERSTITYNKYENHFDNINLKELVLDPGVIQARIKFVAISPDYLSGYSYAYRIPEIENGWINNGTQNFITLTGIDPGKYTIDVKAKNIFGIWSDPRQLTIEFLPPWHQTTWFYLLCALAAAAIAYALYRYRLAQLSKEFQFKDKMAADLHDDLGSTITSIKMFTELGVKSGSAQYYTPVKEGLAEAALALREMIWVLDNKTSNLADVFRKTESIFRPLLKIKETCTC